MDSSVKIINYLKEDLRKRALGKLAGKLDGTSFYERLQEKRLQSIDESTPLLDEGIIDSFGLVGLRSWLEREFKVRIPDEKVTKESFATVKGIISVLNQCQTSLGT